MARANHLVWRRAQAYWRRRLPVDLRLRNQRNEWCLPLGVLTTEDAEQKARYISAMADDLIRQQRAQPPEATPEDLERLARSFFRRKLIEYENRFVEAAAENRSDDTHAHETAISDLTTQIRVIEDFLKGLWPEPVKPAQ